MSTVTVGFAGYSNSGKTTLISRLLLYYKERGVRTAVIKHDGHGHYAEKQGTDSSLFLEAGADGIMVLSPDGYRVFERRRVGLQEAMSKLEETYELILVEGFKREAHPQLAVFRTPEQAKVLEALAAPPLAWITPDARMAGRPPDCPALHPDDLPGIGKFIYPGK